MEKKNYFLEKDGKSGEMLYLEYDKIEGYNITPKTKIEDAIRVNKIVFVNPTLSEKLIRKKIDIKIRHLLNKLNEFNDDGDDESGIQNTLMEAEKLKMMIINNYVKYLGNTYQSLTLKKLQIIINQLKIKLYNQVNQKRMSNLKDLFYLDEEEQDERRGRGR